MIMTVDEMLDEASMNCKDDIYDFILDMGHAGYSIRYYRGRNFYKGPAVVVDSLDEIFCFTRVKCQWDNLGRQYIIYPLESF